jgi:penicillin-binding protein 1A
VSVVNANGSTVHQVHIEREQILSGPVSFQMVSMLEDVVQRGTGAGVRAQGVRGEIGGKTGTTSENRDAWFVGFNSSVVVGVWVGFDQPQKIFEGASGSRVALPIWADFMRRTARRLPAGGFEPPDDLRQEKICMLSYRRALDGCPSYTEYFKEGDSVPTQLCQLHQGTLQQRAERALQGLFGAIGKSIRGIFKR